VVRWATLVLLTLVACNDLRDFRGDWHGPRVPVAHPADPLDAAKVLNVGAGDEALLVIDTVDGHELKARLTVNGLLPETEITSLAGAEADVLSGITFGGNPLRVYLAFVAIPDGGGEALVVVALYDDRRVEVRLLRGANPLYAIFAMTELAT
jgi:hypothetical protein